MLSKFVLNLSVGVGAFVIRLSQISSFFLSSSSIATKLKSQSPISVACYDAHGDTQENTLNARGNLYTSITL